MLNFSTFSSYREDDFVCYYFFYIASKGWLSSDSELWTLVDNQMNKDFTDFPGTTCSIANLDEPGYLNWKKDCLNNKYKITVTE